MTDRTPLRDLLAFDRDRLVVVNMDDPRLSRLRRSRLSASTASNITGCPTRFAVEAALDKVESPFSDADLGTSGHKVLELLYGHPNPDRTTSTASEILNDLIRTHPGDIVFPDDPIQQGVWRSEVATRIAGLWKIENPAEIVVVSTEMAFNTATVAGVPAIGFIDRVDHLGSDADGMLIGIRDYKTGKVKKPYKSNDPHGEQLRIYALAYESVRGRLPTEARVDYVRFGESRVVDLSKPALAKTERYFAKAWEIIADSAERATYETKPSGLCPWCPLATVCPAAIEAGRNKPGRSQTYDDFAAITEVGEQMHLPIITPISSSTIALEASVMTTTDNTEAARPRRLAFNYLTEDKSWEEKASGSLNPNSFAAQAAFGLTEQAVKKLEHAGMAVTGPNVRALAATFAALIEGVQIDMTHGHSFQAGSHVRLRGVLNQVLYTYPVPFGADEAGWAEWFELVTKRMNAVVNSAFWLWDHSAAGFGTTPFTDLVGVQPVAEPAAPTTRQVAPAVSATPEADTALDQEPGGVLVADLARTRAEQEQIRDGASSSAEASTPEPDPAPEAVIAAAPETRPGADEAHEPPAGSAETVPGGYDPSEDF